MMRFWSRTSGRNLHAQVAARHHHPVGAVQDAIQVIERLGFFQLGNHGHIAPALANEPLHPAHVFGGADKGDGDDVQTPCSRPNSKSFWSLSVSDGTLAQRREGRCPVFSEQAAIDHSHSRRRAPINAQLDEPIGTMRSGGATSRASPVKLVEMIEAVLGTSRWG